MATTANIREWAIGVMVAAQNLHNENLTLENMIGDNYIDDQQIERQRQDVEYAYGDFEEQLDGLTAIVKEDVDIK